jgi:ABC-type bacteriocin/lantibiotic exporter with double-glycine peptidase domain
MLQMSAAECGVACVAMVLTAYGRATSIRECREKLGVGRDGTTTLQLAKLARGYGLDVVPFSLDLDALPRLRMPAILHWNFQHYVVLERLTARGAVVVDPAVGRRMVGRDELSTGFTGVALQCVPGRGFTRRRSRRTVEALRFVRGLLTFPRPLLAKVLAASLLLQVLGLVTPLSMKFVLDTVIAHQQADLLNVLVLSAALMVATHGLATYARGVVLNHLQAEMDWGVMRRFFQHLLDLPFQYFQHRTSGDLVMRLASNSIIRDILTGQTVAVLIDGTLVIGYLVLLLVLAPAYGLIVLALSLFQFLVIAVGFRAMRELTYRDVAAQTDAQSYVVEAIAGAETIKMRGAETQVVERWTGLFDAQLGASLRRRRLETTTEALLGSLRLATPLVMLVIGTTQVLSGAMSVGTMLAFNGLAAGLLAPVGALAATTRQLQTVGTHLDRIRDVFDERVEQEVDPGRHRVPELRGGVRLVDVSFRYSAAGPWAIRRASVVIEPGMKVALVGRTGSGKSTLAKIMLGLYPPSSGEVQFDGIALNDLDLKALRRQCGVVNQEPAFFSGSIRYNLAMGNEHASLETIATAAKIAQLHDEIVQMPMGYDTVLTEGGGGLSGGQRQRLALARALVGGPALLLLDEASSNLDAMTERELDRALSAMTCTRVVIAHRLSTVRNADLIVVLDDGEIVQSGRHAELMSIDGPYASLVSGQLESDGEETFPAAGKIRFRSA